MNHFFEVSVFVDDTTALIAELSICGYVTYIL